jgi:hypothetical protein
VKVLRLALCLFFVQSIHCNEMKQNRNPAAFVKSTIQCDLDTLIIPMIKTSFTAHERYLSRNVNVIVVDDKRIMRVRAFESADKQVIEISTGFISLASTLIDADIVAVEFNKIDFLYKYYEMINTFLMNYNDSLALGSTLAQPQPFYQFAKIDEMQYSTFAKSSKYDFEFSVGLRTVLSYTVVHEFAHHIFGHFSTKKPKKLSDSRRNEDEADDFSIRVNFLKGINPVLFCRYFILMSLGEKKPIKGTHTISACRLEKFIKAGIHFSRPYLKTSLDSANYLQLKQGADKLVKLCKESDDMPLTMMPGIW